MFCWAKLTGVLGLFLDEKFALGPTTIMLCCRLTHWVNDCNLLLWGYAAKYKEHGRDTSVATCLQRSAPIITSTSGSTDRCCLQPLIFLLIQLAFLHFTFKWNNQILAWFFSNQLHDDLAKLHMQTDIVPCSEAKLQCHPTI